MFFCLAYSKSQSVQICCWQISKLLLSTFETNNVSAWTFCLFSLYYITVYWFTPQEHNKLSQALSHVWANLKKSGFSCQFSTGIWDFLDLEASEKPVQNPNKQYARADLFAVALFSRRWQHLFSWRWPFLLFEIHVGGRPCPLLYSDLDCGAWQLYFISITTSILESHAKAQANFFPPS